MEAAREKILETLQHGDKTRIAKQLSLSRNYVYMVLSGKNKNENVWLAAAAIAAKRAAAKKKLQEMAKSL